MCVHLSIPLLQRRPSPRSNPWLKGSIDMALTSFCAPTNETPYVQLHTPWPLLYMIRVPGSFHKLAGSGEPAGTCISDSRGTVRSFLRTKRRVSGSE
jgi:hypothetical protein